MTRHPHIAQSVSTRYPALSYPRSTDNDVSCAASSRPQYTAELKRSMREPLDAKKEAVEELLEKLALQVGVY